MGWRENSNTTKPFNACQHQYHKAELEDTPGVYLKIDVEVIERSTCKPKDSSLMVLNISSRNRNYYLRPNAANSLAAQVKVTPLDFYGVIVSLMTFNSRGKGAIKVC